MKNLIPVELWEYGIDDVAKGIAANIGVYKNRQITLPGIGNCMTVGSGRAALVMGLRALDLKPKAQVGVPLYCCPVVLKAIESAGCQPLFIDIDPDTFCISPIDLEKKIKNIDAIIAVHMFGNMSDMGAIRAVSRNKPIIEDCAQALGSKIDDRKAGLFGDISFYSFRSGKYLSAGEGGAIYTKDKTIRDRLNKAIEIIHDSSYKDELLHVFKIYIRSKLRTRPLYGLVGHKLWALYNRRVDRSTGATISVNKIYKSDLEIATKRLNKIDAVIKVQRKNTEYYMQNLELDEGMVCKENYGTFYNRYLFPLILPSLRQRDLMASYMLSNGIGTIKPYYDIPSIASKYYGYQWNCQESEKAARCLLAIPVHHHLKNQELQRIISCTNKGWAKYRNNK